MTPFLLASAPLEGANLIESSAGTGKTYAISGLFLRLILEKGLRPDEILVVTFTRAATDELKERIRSKLTQALEGFEGGSHPDPLIDRMVMTYENTNLCRRRIRDALADFDKAAIFTIHAFCQRVLAENAFEARNLFDIELKTESKQLAEEVSDDFWRRQFFDAPPEWAGYALANNIGPGTFCALLGRMQSPDMRVVPHLTEPVPIHVSAYRQRVAQLRMMWPTACGQMADLLCHAGLNGNIYGSTKPPSRADALSQREGKVTRLLAAMNRFIDSDTGFPLPPELTFFTTSKLKKSLRKGQVLPEHPLFDLCELLTQAGAALETVFDAFLCYLKSSFFVYAGRELEQRKRRQNIQFFDDLLLSLRGALARNQPGATDSLARSIRRQYKAALVDEFQDTDTIQYEIFSRLFPGAEGALFMIGDPKQAIYGFRGADVFSYLKASREAKRKYTLAENWRAAPDLVQAVNTLFSQVEIPFALSDIPFDPVSSGLRALEGDTGFSPSAPFILWLVDSPDGKPVSIADATERVLGAVVAEIERVAFCGCGGLRPGDIAVLVRTNQQARWVKSRLSVARIPAVLFSAGSVFQTDEALSLERVLAAIADPGDHGRLKAALATDWFAIPGENLQPDSDPEGFTRHLTRFREYHHQWQRFGFISMVRLMAAREKIRSRVLMSPGGERRLTNFLHLCELLQQESMENHRGMIDLVRWLYEQRQREDTSQETHQLRLENDDDAVKILTIHKSKGLEFPIVFCPFLWNGVAWPGENFVFHDPATEGRLTLDIGSEDRSAHAVMAQNEALAENLRLLYVAVTRAKQKCYLAWGRIKNSETAALAYLVHAREGGDLSPPGQAAPDAIDSSRVDSLKARMSGLAPRDFDNDLDRLMAAAEGTMALSNLPGGSVAARRRIAPGPPPALCRRRFGATIDSGWQVCSFSSLVTGSPRHAFAAEREDDLRAELSAPEALPLPRRRDLFSFPPGPRAGIFFHDLLEHVDFASDLRESREALVPHRLQKYGYDPGWQPAVEEMLSRVAAAPLRCRHEPFCLQQVPLEQQVREMEFHFPLKPITPLILRQIFKNHGAPTLPAEFPGRLGQLTFDPAYGLMKGIIDLVFSAHGRYYLVDWKSNYLGLSADNYRGVRLTRSMSEGHYYLQYHLYALALHRHLATRLAGYRFERHFGGVFYVFLRGVDPTAAPGAGIYADRPSCGLIDALEQALIDRP